jgi:hypothetical protein
LEMPDQGKWNMVREYGKKGDTLIGFARYNVGIIFANKFIYFLLAALAFFLLVAAINFFGSGSDPDVGSIYYTLMFPGLLLIFYPAAFGIQNDIDSGMIEILFGIPNYRYKVWLVRLVLIYVLVFVIMVIFSTLSSFILVRVPVFNMVYHLMFPVFFIGSLAFMLSTIVRNGNGTAVIVVIIGLAFWISSAWTGASKWNLFLNPFNIPQDINEVIWADVVFKNRMYLTVGIVLAVLYGLFNLQKREKFVQ